MNAKDAEITLWFLTAFPLSALELFYKIGVYAAILVWPDTPIH